MLPNAFVPNLSYINLNMETSSLFITGGPSEKENSLIFHIHSVAVKDTSCTIRLLAKFELPARTSNKSCHNLYNSRGGSPTKYFTVIELGVVKLAVAILPSHF